MRKKIICFFLCFSAVLCFAGCKKTAETSKTGEPSSPALTQTQFDIDLSGASETIAYPEVYSMFEYPQAYDGKTIRLSGLFSAVYENVEENDLRFYCQVSDATACCSIGIELDPKSSLSFPDDFPMESSKITVTGTLKQKSDGTVFVSEAEIYQ